MFDKDDELRLNAILRKEYWSTADAVFYIQKVKGIQITESSLRTAISRGGGLLFHNMIYTADGAVFKNKTGNKGLRQYKYYKCGTISLPAGDFDAIICNNVRDFLNSDMGALPDTTRLSLKQLEYSDELARALIDRIVYHEHKLTIFINIADLDKLGAFRKGDYINTQATPMEYCQSPDGKQVIIEQVVYLSSHTCINHRNAGCSRDLLTKTEKCNHAYQSLGVWLEIQEGL